jgi:hypothetical protein
LRRLVLAQGAAAPSEVFLLEEEEAHAVSQKFENWVAVKVRTIQRKLFSLKSDGFCYRFHKLLPESLNVRVQHTILFGYHVIKSNL